MQSIGELWWESEIAEKIRILAIKNRTVDDLKVWGKWNEGDFERAQELLWKCYATQPDSEYSIQSKYELEQDQRSSMKTPHSEFLGNCKFSYTIPIHRRENQSGWWVEATEDLDLVEFSYLNWSELYSNSLVEKRRHVEVRRSGTDDLGLDDSLSYIHVFEQ